MKALKITFLLFAIVSLGYSQSSSIKVEVIGKGNPVIYLPGFTTPGAIWKETVAHVSTAHEAHLVSYAGFNGIAPIEMPWYNTIKNELIQYIKNQKLTNITVIGHSMGGNLATHLAAEIPNTVSNLIIVDALACMREVMMPGVPADNLQYESPYNNQVINMNEEQFKQTATLMATNMTNKKDKIDDIIKWIMEADRKTYAYGYTDLLKLDLRNALSNIKAKTLILGASFPTSEIAKTNFEKQYINLPNKTLTMASNSKHFIMFDQPEWFYKQVNDFLTHE
ncbi:alpha/beta hydrolase [Aquimarina sp. D1M17]|uniref:alpha/beta fold hydrolase n=1 Tax=Aquimarina acroporae TaxID=2937283 RepID=UPI0020C1465F|nr:alpha/beta hydrolase [Aquimarina acroporae]MCK8522935.1 alpha/beta hydrolase [Aquimarina acroporae]